MVVCSVVFGKTPMELSLKEWSEKIKKIRNNMKKNPINFVEGGFGAPQRGLPFLIDMSCTIPKFFSHFF